MSVNPGRLILERVRLFSRHREESAPSFVLRRVQLVALVVGLAALAWAIWLALGGGVRAEIAGHLIRSTDPWRSAELAFSALTLFVITGGHVMLAPVWRRVRAALEVRPAIGVLATAESGGLVIAAVVVASGLTYMTTAASGADGSGYVSQADRWIHGTLKPPQPWVGEVPWPDAGWTFAPLGYKPVAGAPTFAQAPTYSPGLPLMMAAAKLVGGQAALFLVVPLCAGVLVLATFGVARRLQGSWCGLLAAWLVATSPIVLFMLMVPMSDVPAAAAWTTALFFLLADGAGPALAAGLFSGVATVIRPNLFFLAAIMSLWFALSPGFPSLRRRWRDAVLYGAGLAPGLIFVGAFYEYTFGSPFVSGYGRFTDLLARTNVWPNLQRYFGWAIGAQATFVVLGLIGLFIPWVWPRGRSRRAAAILAIMFGAVAAEYCFYIVFNDWYFLRFLLPAWPLLAIGVAGVAFQIWKWSPDRVRFVLVGAFIAIGVVGVRTARDKYAFQTWHHDRRYTAAANLIRTISPPNSVVFSFELSGSLRYYSGRMPVRYDLMSPDWLDRSVDWFARSGVHSYAVLDGSELQPFRARFKDQKTVRAVDAPILVYQAFNEQAVVYIFDLTTPPKPGAPVQLVTETDAGRWRNWPPGPAPTLVLRHLDGLSPR